MEVDGSDEFSGVKKLGQFSGFKKTVHFSGMRQAFFLQDHFDQYFRTYWKNQNTGSFSGGGEEGLKFYFIVWSIFFLRKLPIKQIFCHGNQPGFHRGH